MKLNVLLTTHRSKIRSKFLSEPASQRHKERAGSGQTCTNLPLTCVNRNVKLRAE